MGMRRGEKVPLGSEACPLRSVEAPLVSGERWHYIYLMLTIPFMQCGVAAFISFLFSDQLMNRW